jgi:hypothetical protein
MVKFACVKVVTLILLKNVQKYLEGMYVSVYQHMRCFNYAGILFYFHGYIK